MADRLRGRKAIDHYRARVGFLSTSQPDRVTKILQKHVGQSEEVQLVYPDLRVADIFWVVTSHAVMIVNLKDRREPVRRLVYGAPWQLIQGEVRRTVRSTVENFALIVDGETALRGLVGSAPGYPTFVQFMKHYSGEKRLD